MDEKVFGELKNIFKNDVILNADLKKYSTFKIGGSAKAVLRVRSYKNLLRFIEWADKRKVRYIPIGKGSNVLFADEGYEGIILILDGYFKKVKIKGEKVKAGAGVLLSALLNKVKKAQLSGLEFCVGIPGTIGGAVSGNVGLKKECIFDVIESIEGVGNADICSLRGKKIFLKREDIPYSYRDSGLKNIIVTFANFRFIKRPIQYINERISWYREQRKNQPSGVKSAGCIFKNPEGDFAGRLIESAGLKGLRIGDAQISEIHSNYIINKGQAQAKDVMSLIKKIKKEVKDKFDVTLELEIKIIK